MNPPVLDYTAGNPLVGNPAWLGYRIDKAKGDIFWQVCAWCESRHPVEAEAERLGVRVSHGMCPRHYAEEIARITGDLL